MTKRTKLFTCTTMIQTNGTTSVYGVFVGPMGGRYFNARKAHRIATYTRQSTSGGMMQRIHDIETFEREMTARHATIDAPAVYWQA